MERKRSLLIPIVFLVVFSLILGACAAQETQSELVPTDADAEQSLADESDGESTDGFVEIPLPENFPSSFPIPDGARIGYSGRDPAEGSFQILVHFGSSLEEALAFFRQSLSANDWTLLEDEAVEDGHAMRVSNPEYEGELYYVVHEGEAYIDVSLDPAGTIPDISDVSENFGSSTALGESGTDFPADFPLPVGAEPIDVPAKLADEGYQLAYAYPDMPELAYIQFSAAIASSGWMLGEFQMGTNSYTMPFSNPGTGFEGYALITSSPDVAGLGNIQGCIVAFHPGTNP